MFRSINKLSKRIAISNSIYLITVIMSHFKNAYNTNGRWNAGNADFNLFNNY